MVYAQLLGKKSESPCNMTIYSLYSPALLSAPYNFELGGTVGVQGP